MPDKLTPEDVAYLLNVPEDYMKQAIEIIESYVKESNKRQRDICAKQVAKGIVSVTFNLPDKIRNAPEAK